VHIGTHFGQSQGLFPEGTVFADVGSVSTFGGLLEGSEFKETSSKGSMSSWRSSGAL
jgi:hypothetical protein